MMGAEDSSFAPIAAVAAAMRGYTQPWFVSGGWAIDLFAGRVSRHHEDLEIGTFRHDQALFQQHFADWTLAKVVETAEGNAWQPWHMGEWLELPMFQVRAQRAGGTPPEFDCFLNDAADGVWQFRRNPAITRPAATIVLHTPDGIPFLAPEIQLAYKAKYHRPKDDHDFATALPLLNAAQRAWLATALRAAYGDDPWLAQLV